MVRAPDNPSPPILQSGAAPRPPAPRPPNPARPRLYTCFLRKYSDPLMSWSPQNPDFKLLAFQQPSNFKEPELSTDLFLRWKWGAWQTGFKAQVEDITLCSAQNQGVPKYWTHGFSIMKETVIQDDTMMNWISWTEVFTEKTGQDNGLTLSLLDKKKWYTIRPLRSENCLWTIMKP